jgi:hypothetical protein
MEQPFFGTHNWGEVALLRREFPIKSKTVAYRHFGERHTGENVKAAFVEVLSEYA